MAECASPTSVSQTGFVEQPETNLGVRNALLCAHALVEPKLRIDTYAHAVFIANARTDLAERRDRRLEVRVVVDRFVEIAHAAAQADVRSRPVVADEPCRDVLTELRLEVHPRVVVERLMLELQDHARLAIRNVLAASDRRDLAARARHRLT